MDLEQRTGSIQVFFPPNVLYQCFLRYGSSIAGGKLTQQLVLGWGQPYVSAVVCDLL